MDCIISGSLISKQSTLCIDDGWYGFVFKNGVGMNEEVRIHEGGATEVVDLAIPKAV